MNSLIFDGQKQIGEINFSSAKLTVKLYSKEYMQAFISLTEYIIKKGEFQVDFDKENLEIKNAPDLFYKAIRQELFTSLNLLVK